MRGTCEVDVAFEAVDGSGFADPEGRDRLATMLWLMLEARWPGCAWTVQGSVCYATMPVAPAQRPRLAEAVADVLEQARTTLDVELRAGIGSAAGGRSRYEAAQALAALRRRAGGPRVADVEHGNPVGVLAVVGDLVDGWAHLRSKKLDVLRRHDAAHGTAYLDSLRAYLDSFGDVTATARALGVPVQTVRYRLSRAVAMASLDFGDIDERLACTVELAVS